MMQLLDETIDLPFELPSKPKHMLQGESLCKTKCSGNCKAKCHNFAKNLLDQCRAPVTCGNSFSFFYWLLTIPSLLLFSHTSKAALITGRLSVGGYISKETISAPGETSGTNDFATVSSRLYLKVQNLGGLDFVTDLRDKHDFFDKLSADRRSLKDANDFQVREASARYPNPGGVFFTSLGRFSILEAGSVFVDGIELGSKLHQNLKLGTFGGHNPKRPEYSYLRSDNPDITYGAYLSSQSPPGNTTKFYNSSHAYVVNSVNGFNDRQYFYSQIHYQYNSLSRILSNLYIDFVPRTFLQNGNLLFHHGFSKNFDASLQLSAIDTITYSRSRNVLETLPSSPYQDASVHMRAASSSSSQWLADLRYGKRELDNKVRQEGKLGYRQLGLLSSRLDITTFIGYRQEFITQGPEFLLESSYFSRSWEYGLNFQTSVEERTDNDANNPASLHPMTIEAYIANLTSGNLFSTLSIEYARNEIVSILSAFFKITYRFGPSDLPPVRERAPQVRAR